MTEREMFALADGLARAKSRGDVAAAMTHFDDGMELLTPAFGTRARGLAENEAVLKRFFASFPDYAVDLDGSASDGEHLVCWGRARMTMTGERFGVVPNGRRAELPVTIRFTFRGGKIASEHFFFDLSELCAQSGVSTDAVRERIFRGRRDAA